MNVRKARIGSSLGASLGSGGHHEFPIFRPCQSENLKTVREILFNVSSDLKLVRGRPTTDSISHNFIPAWRIPDKQRSEVNRVTFCTKRILDLIKGQTLALKIDQGLNCYYQDNDKFAFRYLTELYCFATFIVGPGFAFGFRICRGRRYGSVSC